jgi:hypothetical protein
MRFSELQESAPPGMEKWIKDRKPEFKKRYGDRWQEVLYATAWKHKKNESLEQNVTEMDSQKPQGRYKSDGTRSHSTYGSRDHYNLGDPETTLGPDSMLTAKDAAKKAAKTLDKAFSKSHKKGVAEGFGSNYAEQLAQQVFDHNPNIKDEDQVLNLGYNISKSDLGRRAQGIFRDEDFPSDFVSAYSYLQKQGVAEGSLNEFAPLGGDGGDDGFSEETLKQLAAQWYNGDEDPRVERTLAAAGWEIGQDEGYDDEPGVFVVQAGDVNGRSYMSWPAHELQQGVAEGYTVTRGIDKERYQARPGLEGPFSTKSGKVVYYDKVEGKYYDPDTDMYIEYDDWRAMNEGGSALSQAVREAGWGRRSSYYNPMDQERREQDQMDYARRAFKRAEMQHELGHEDDPNFERNLRQQQIDKDRGPWYIRIDGVIYKQKGQPKSFDWKRGANNYALAMIKNNPSLQGKVLLSKSAEDKAKESVTESAEQLEERKKAKKKHKVTVRNPDTGRKIKVDFGEPDDIIKRKKR